MLGCPSFLRSQGAIIQFVDVVQLNIRGLTAREKFSVPRVVALPWEDSGDPLTPHLLDSIEDAQLIVDHYILLCRIKTLNLGEFFFLMDIDEHAVFEGRPESGAHNFSRLEHRIAVREDNRRTPLLDVAYGMKRAGIKPVSKRIVDEPARHPQHPWIVHLFEPESLQCAEVVRIAELPPQLFENVPVKFTGIAPICFGQIGGQIGLDAIIIKKRVVDIEKKDEVVRRGHGANTFGFGLCHGPSGPISALAFSGPQLPCS
jgi:hypothetical protein